MSLCGGKPGRPVLSIQQSASKDGPAATDPEKVLVMAANALKRRSEILIFNCGKPFLATPELA
jgi:hypothetical protein